jgi:hypothetical protein
VNISQIPVLNAFNGSMVVSFDRAMDMILKGKARPVGPHGGEYGLELLYANSSDINFDSASVKQKAAIVGRNSRYEVVEFDGEDAYPGMPVLPVIGYNRSSAA